MKRLSLLPALLLITFVVSAQISAKKYVMLEHFTNSKCSVCASRNPAFYSLIGQAQYADDVHHISIHPSVPYNTCVFYLANMAQNNAWAAVYNIQGTPRVALNGRLLPASSQLLRPDTLAKYVDQTSPLYLKVTESGTGINRSVSIDATALGSIPAGNFKLYVALAEKTINQTTSNGESVHHDVFRQMLTPVSGQDFMAPTAGQSLTFNFNYTINNSWNGDEIYALAFIKDADNGTVLNSGTKFDPVLTLSALNPSGQGIELSPNPASDITFAKIGNDQVLRTEVYASNGQLVYATNEAQANGTTISTATFTPGVYFVKITGEKGIYTAKLVKE